MNRGSWPQLANTVLGVWLMASPGLLAYDDPAATNDYICGPLVASFAFVAAWDVTRFMGRANLAVGGWLLVAPWLLGYGEIEAVNSLVVGLLICGLSAIGGRVQTDYGGGWPAIWSGLREEHD